MELRDFIGFGFDLNYTQDGLQCWRMGFIFLWLTVSSPDKDSGERSRTYGPSCLYIGTTMADFQPSCTMSSVRLDLIHIITHLHVKV